MSLTDTLLARIAADGPISVAEFMADCLLHPEHGYYTTREPFGTAGDFITAPEISQMFGELIGLCLAQSWLDQGAPERPLLVELGPGRGTLMRDALRAMRAVPTLTPEVILIDASPRLRAVQAQTLEGHDVHWADALDDIPPNRPLLLIANEFFDALPIRQYQRHGEGWCELRLGAADGALTWGLGARDSVLGLAHRLEDTKDGDIVETCAPALPLIQRLSTQIAQHSGAALIIDYGDWRSLGSTLQALKNHEPIDPLDGPGTADLTAHVDFEALANACASGTVHSRVTPQGIFLERLGITARAQALAQKLSGATRDQHIAAHRRLTHPAEMGNLFKVIGIVPDSAPPPPGLET